MDSDKRIYRSKKNKIIAGVCSGIAEYFNIDPTIVRIIFILLIFGQGAGILIYIICWFIIPEEPENTKEKTEQKDKKEHSDTTTVEHKIDHKIEDKLQNTIKPSSKTRTSQFFGIALIALGVLFLLNQFSSRFSFSKFWPIILILLGAVILINTNKKG